MGRISGNSTKMVSGTLFTYPGNFRAEKILSVAKMSESDVKVDDKFVFGETNKSDAFLKKFPLGKVPAFEGSDGTCLFESDAIAWYVANAQLKGGSTPVAQAEVVQWMSFAQNKALLTKTYLVGERITLADVCVAYAMKMLFENVLEPGFRKPYGNTVRWYTTIMNQPAVVGVSGTPKLAEKMAQFDPKKFAEMQGAGGDKKDNKKADKKKEPKKKEEKPKQEKKEEPKDEVPAEPKAKDPFAALPPGTMVMDEWKKMFSNNPEDVSMPWFWENFDHEANSIWYCEYMYPDELRLTFMSANLVGGMTQRLDRLSKYAFGAVAVFGSNNNSSISGVWCWRGQDLAFELSEDLQIDYSSYKWTKLDSKSEETKKKVEDYFRQQGQDSKGRDFCDGKIFK